MYELIAKLVYDEMNNYRCIKKEYIGTLLRTAIMFVKSLSISFCLFFLDLIQVSYSLGS